MNGILSHGWGMGSPPPPPLVLDPSEERPPESVGVGVPGPTETLPTSTCIVDSAEILSGDSTLTVRLYEPVSSSRGTEMLRGTVVDWLGLRRWIVAFDVFQAAGGFVIQTSSWPTDRFPVFVTVAFSSIDSPGGTIPD